MSRIRDDLLRNLPQGDVSDVLIGMHWTAVVAETDSGRQCGLASTLSKSRAHHGQPDVPQAGQLTNLSGTELAFLAKSEEQALASIGIAAVNALSEKNPADWIDLNAEDVIVKHGAGKKVALIGRFPFTSRLRSQVGELQVLEQSPGPGDLPASAAPEVIPRADVVAITGTTLINHTAEDLLNLCSARSLVIILGPSTPLSPILFDYGADILCGSVVTSIGPVLKTVGQGGNFRQVHRAGVRTVTMTRSRYN